MPLERSAGAILAGGRSLRMGGHPKALADLAGRPLLRHVIERASPQVQQLCLSVDQVSAAWAGFGLPQVADPRPGHQGPLGGLLAAMEFVAGQADWLLLLPCDAPFLPPNLATKLHERAVAAGSPGSVVSYLGHPQPTFSLWHRDLLPSLRQAVEVDGLAGFRQFLDRCRLAELAWPVENGLPPFFNVNSPADLAQAREWLAANDRRVGAC